MATLRLEGTLHRLNTRSGWLQLDTPGSGIILVYFNGSTFYVKNEMKAGLQDLAMGDLLYIVYRQFGAQKIADTITAKTPEPGGEGPVAFTTRQ
jgi:hypothetical protein